MTTVPQDVKRSLQQPSMWTQIKKHLPFYLFLLLPLIQVIIFNYLPMYGIQIAFKDFKMRRGIMGSSWVGFEHFERMFNDKTFYRVLFNTLKISFLSLIVNFPLTIIFALMMNEVKHARFKRVTQTITYLPHFLSWVVVGSFVYQILSPSSGIINALLVKFGLIDNPIYFMIKKEYFVPIYLIVSVWKGLGWSIVIYLAAIAGIDTSLYEAASIDGAGRLRQVLSITLPSIMPTIATMLILSLGSLLNVGFDAIFNLYNEGTYEVADVISTYVYRRGMIDAKYDYTTAIGLFQNVASILLVLTGNWVSKRLDPDFRIL
ncbi:MAG: ABC transporter permease subunit [Bacillota bacterium]|nr:ABC transporter permease subunit [Bacillota bacterium]